MYNPMAGVCLPNDVSYKAYGIWAIPIAFDVVILGLTTFKSYQHVQKEAGALIVRMVHNQFASLWIMISVFKALYPVPRWTSVSGRLGSR